MKRSSSRVHSVSLRHLGLIVGATLALSTSVATAADPASRIDPVTPAQLLPLSAVRLLDQGPFAPAVAANRTYVLALDADRLVATRPAHPVDTVLQEPIWLHSQLNINDEEAPQHAYYGLHNFERLRLRRSITT